MILEVGGPALRPGQRVGWGFSPAHARLDASGLYRGAVERVTAIALERQICVRLGNATIKLADGSTAAAPGDLCRFDIDPEAIQVWPLD
jgi:hypothetical protein